MACCLCRKGAQAGPSELACELASGAQAGKVEAALKNGFLKTDEMLQQESGMAECLKIRKEVARRCSACPCEVAGGCEVCRERRERRLVAAQSSAPPHLTRHAPTENMATTRTTTTTTTTTRWASRRVGPLPSRAL